MDANKHKYKRMKDCSLLQNIHICSGAHSPAHRGLFSLGVKRLGRESDQFYLVDLYLQFPTTGNVMHRNEFNGYEYQTRGKVGPVHTPRRYRGGVQI